MRREALQALAKADRRGELRVLFDAIAAIDQKKEEREETVIFDLVRLATSRGPAELAAARGELVKLATTAQQPVIRQIGFVSLISVDGSADKAWQLGLKSAGALRDLVNAVPLIPDASVRASLYSRIEPLLKGLPAELAPKAAGKTIRGRYVRIELPGRQRTLTLAEVEVISDGRNVARRGKASQKNTAHGGDASKGIDGNKSGRFGDGGQTHTAEGTNGPWWEVDLGAELPIDSIAIYNRTDSNLRSRLNNFTLRVLDKDRKVVFEKVKNRPPDPSVSFEVGGEAPEVLVRRAAMNALTSVRGQEAKTFQTLARFLGDAADRSAAIHALQRIPRNQWPKEEAKPLLDVLLAFIRKVPVKERTAPAVLDALEFADALTTLLPPDQGKALRAELGELGVRVVRIATLPERMAYDKEIIVVRAGKPVEFLLDNTDLMPHNFVITAPGALEEIGTIAEATATQPDAQARHFVPRSAKVLLGSRLLQPRESEKLSWTAPNEPGVYPYVCTYPGHWRRMYGALYVVEDLEAYRANPEAYLASSKLPVKDDLLKDRRPRTEWKFEDLAAAVAEMKHGRSHGNGKQMFQVASCVGCHKLEGVGTQFGPDLAQLDPKLKPVDILKEMLDPSALINEKFQTYVIGTKAGKTITGLILEEKGGAIKVIENPLVKAEPLVLKESEIESREKSPVSVMPKGLLDKLTRDEILDLIAYVIARGNREHALFKGEGHGHQH